MAIVRHVCDICFNVYNYGLEISLLTYLLNQIKSNQIYIAVAPYVASESGDSLFNDESLHETYMYTVVGKVENK